MLGLLAWVCLSLLLAPVGRWFENREALATSLVVRERLARHGDRAAAVAALASRPNAPFLTAADKAGALLALQGRIEAAAPAGAMRIEAIQPLADDPRPIGPVSVRFDFAATQGALFAFLSDVETRPPYLDVEALNVTASRDDTGDMLLSGTATLSAVPLLRAQP